MMRLLFAALLLVLISTSAFAVEPQISDRHGPGAHFLDSRPLQKSTRKLASAKPHKVAAKPKPPVAPPQSQVEPAVDDLASAMAVIMLPVEQAENIFKKFFASLMRPVGNCKEFETVDATVKTVVLDAAKHFGSPALLSSCYRSPEHNRRVGGARRSQHMARKALDFKIAGVAPVILAKYVRQHPLMRKRGGVGVYRWGIHADSGKYRNWGRRFA